MESYFKLGLLGLIPVAFSVAFYFLQKKTHFGKTSYWFQQIIIGIAFGLVAICGTEFGVPVAGATANARDAAPLSAGLIFGGPAGIIAGLIGGIERWFAAGWGKGEYTQIACSVSTIISGFMAAGLRKLLFDDKRPTWGIGFAVGVIMEVIHMTLVVVTHISDAKRAFEIVKGCTGPMVVANAFATGLALLVIGVISKSSENREKRKKNISQQVQFALLMVVVLAYFITTLFIFVLQTNINRKKMEELMDANLGDILTEVTESSDNAILEKARMCANEFNRNPEANINDIAVSFEVSELNVVDSEGFIINSNNPEFIGYDMNSGEQSAYFADINKFKYTSRVQEYGPISFQTGDTVQYRKYAAYALEEGGFVQVGYDAEQFQKELASEVEGLTKNRHVDLNGYIVIADKKENIVSVPGRINKEPKDFSGHTLSDIGFNVDRINPKEGKSYTLKIYGIDSWCRYVSREGYHILGVVPVDEAYEFRDMEVLVNSYLEVLVFGLLFGVIYFLIKKLVVDNIRKINYSLGKIIDGNLDVTVDVHSSDEFSSLSDDINSTVDTLKRYIAEAAARIDKELAYAKSIQQAALPALNSSITSIPEFDVFATMNTAKEVGGDFYDFYTLGDNKLAFLIADVSGKGIPAAMFMMTAKTMLKNMAENDLSVEEVMTSANDHLCENNEAGMFVTVWMGILDYKTGHVTYANAGHNPPLVYRKASGKFEFLRTRPGFVLAGMEGICYKLWDFDMESGDRIYLYTDGVTEATDTHDELYGEERLLEYINAHAKESQADILKGVQDDIDKFIDGADQFDDITMVMVDWFGPKPE